MDGSQKCAGWKKEARRTKKFILDNSIFMKFDYRPNYAMETETSAVAASARDGARDGAKTVPGIDRDWPGGGFRGSLQVVKMYILTGLVVMQNYIFINIHQTVQLRIKK